MALTIISTQKVPELFVKITRRGLEKVRANGTSDGDRLKVDGNCWNVY